MLKVAYRVYKQLLFYEFSKFWDFFESTRENVNFFEIQNKKNHGNFSKKNFFSTNTFKIIVNFLAPTIYLLEKHNFVDPFEQIFCPKCPQGHYSILRQKFFLWNFFKLIFPLKFCAQKLRTVNTNNFCSTTFWNFAFFLTQNLKITIFWSFFSKNYSKKTFFSPKPQKLFWIFFMFFL